MNDTSALTLYLVPASDWEEKPDPQDDISLFVEDALAIEQRLKKGVNLVNERKRYQLCCRRIQEAALRKRGVYESDTLGEGYFSLLQEMYEQHPGEMVQQRIASCFFPPGSTAEQIAVLKKLTLEAPNGRNGDVEKRIAFFERALSIKAGVIEIPTFAVIGKQSVEAKRFEKTNASTIPGQFDDDELSDEQIKDMTDILRARIEKALSTGCEVNFSNQPHFIISEVLNGYVYQTEKGEKTASVRVVYLDGSEAEAIPLRCLSKPLMPESIDTHHPPLQAALVSMRHLELDEQVDFAWFRNRKVSASLTCADTDAYCTAETIAMLRNHSGILNLHLYQTGLEPAVVGFYRGLIRVLLDRKQIHGAPLLRVIPRYYDHKSGCYRSGKTWG